MVRCAIAALAVSAGILASLDERMADFSRRVLYPDMPAAGVTACLSMRARTESRVPCSCPWMAASWS